MKREAKRGEYELLAAAEEGDLREVKRSVEGRHLLARCSSLWMMCFVDYVLCGVLCGVYMVCFVVCFVVYFVVYFVVCFVCAQCAVFAVHVLRLHECCVLSMVCMLCTKQVVAIVVTRLYSLMLAVTSRKRMKYSSLTKKR